MKAVTITAVLCSAVSSACVNEPSVAEGDSSGTTDGTIVDASADVEVLDARTEDGSDAGGMMVDGGGDAGPEAACLFAQGCCDPRSRIGPYRITYLGDGGPHILPNRLVAYDPELPENPPAYEPWTHSETWDESGCRLDRRVRHAWDCVETQGVVEWRAISTTLDEDAERITGTVVYSEAYCAGALPYEGTWEFVATRESEP